MRYRYVDELGITYYVAPIEGAADGTPLYAVYCVHPGG